MSYRLEPGEAVQDAVRRIAEEQIEKAIGEVEDSQIGLEETVHQARKRCKKIRGLLRLARPAFEKTYEKENASFRDAARQLSELRDATSCIECLDDLREHAGDETGHLESARALLAAFRDDLYGADDVEARLSRFRDAMGAALGRLDAWSLDAEGFDVVGDGAARTYRRAREAMDAAYEEESAEAFHEWRKRAKYHRYHVRLLRDLWKPVMEARFAAAKELTDFLGDAHDLAVLRDWLVAERGRFDAQADLRSVLAVADHRRKELEARALPVGRRLFADKAKSWRRRANAYWEGLRIERELEPALHRT